MIGWPEHPMSWFGLPPDPVAWTALGLGLVLFLLPGQRLQRLARLPLRPTTALLSGAAAVLSVGYFHYYLGGSPRIVDAGTYLLEARTLATRHFSFPVPEPTALFRGRFLTQVLGAQEPPGPLELAPIFPPGYPALLSLGVLAGDYRLVGPLLAATTTALTAWLAWEITESKQTSLLAALLSLLCAALRYQTADTMSHGLSVPLFTAALAISVHMTKKGTSPGLLASLGGCLGWLVATRQLTGVVGLIACLSVLWSPKNSAERKKGQGKPRDVFAFIAGLAPGLLLLGTQHLAITGDLLLSPQIAYYQSADGPPGCFGLGLGKGCHYEHADVVTEQGTKGLTLEWMLRNTLYRLHWHSLDVANLELLWPFGVFWLARYRKRPGVALLLTAMVLLSAAYALFYFQGSYPGGGARFFAALIPIVQVGLAAAFTERKMGRHLVALSLVGFSLHAVHLHRALPGLKGKPQPQKMVDGVPAAVSAHAFNVLFDPARVRAGQAPPVVRWTGDSRTLEPPEEPRPLVFESEADWPVLGQQALWTHPDFVDAACVSRGQALALHPVPWHPESHGVEARGPALELELTGAPSGNYLVTLHFYGPSLGCISRRVGQHRLPQHLHLPPETLSPMLLQGVTHLDRVTAIPAGKRANRQKIVDNQELTENDPKLSREEGSWDDEERVDRSHRGAGRTDQGSR